MHSMKTGIVIDAPAAQLCRQSQVTRLSGEAASENGVHACRALLPRKSCEGHDWRGSLLLRSCPAQSPRLLCQQGQPALLACQRHYCVQPPGVLPRQHYSSTTRNRYARSWHTRSFGPACYCFKALDLTLAVIVGFVRPVISCIWCMDQRWTLEEGQVRMLLETPRTCTVVSIGVLG
jgi:hypothetical protein